MTTILMTGFEPFGGETTNPSWQAVQLAAARWDRPEQLVISELSVDFGAADNQLRNLLRRHRPDIAIAVGQAGGRAQVTPERIAINVDDARIPDNAGNQPIDVAIVADGPAAWFSTLPIKASVAAIQAQGIPAAVSNSAGTYLCNHIFYVLMHTLASELPQTRGGFVHVPYSPEQVAAASRPQPSLPINLIADALVAIVRTSLITEHDLALIGGTEH